MKTQPIDPNAEQFCKIVAALIVEQTRVNQKAPAARCKYVPVLRWRKATRGE